MKIREQLKHQRPELRRRVRLRRFRGMIVVRSEDGFVGRLRHGGSSRNNWWLRGAVVETLVTPWQTIKPAQSGDLLRYRLEGGK